MVYALGDVSGAHFNPAVTLAVFCTSDNRDNLSVLHAGMYMLTQVFAGIVAQFTYYAIYSGESFPLGPGKGYGWSQVALAEILFTFVLCLVVISVAGKGKSHDGTMFGLAIGSCVTVGGYAIGKISGGSLNPAVSIGIASSEIIKMGPIYNGFIYAGLEFVGALAAAGIVKVTHAEANKDVEN
jgi:aquaporin Z